MFFSVTAASLRKKTFQSILHASGEPDKCLFERRVRGSNGDDRQPVPLRNGSKVLHRPVRIVRVDPPLVPPLLRPGDPGAGEQPVSYRLVERDLDIPGSVEGLLEFL